jgi:predicted transposase YdaD
MWVDSYSLFKNEEIRMLKINSQNYDLAFKESFSIFENKTLEFLGLDLPKITEFLETEYAEIETHHDFLDITFRLVDGSILHIEEETHLSTEDLIRFAHYDLRLYQRHRAMIHTVVLTPASGSPGTKSLDTGTIQYNIRQIILKGRNADVLLEKIRNALENGEAVNELELIFLPLMQSILHKNELLLETIKLEKQLPDTIIRIKVLGLTLVVANRIVDEKLLDEIWEEVRMLKIMQYAEEKGLEKGLEKGREEGIEIGLEKGREEGREKGKLSIIKRLLFKKFGMLPDEISHRIDTLDETKLDEISVAILDMQQVDDLKKFIHVT